MTHPASAAFRPRCAVAANPASPGARPSADLLNRLRARVERGCPFKLAREVCGVDDATHEAWMKRGGAQHAAQPDYVERPGGGAVLGGSLEPEAEYVRVALQQTAKSAAHLVDRLWVIADDPKRGRDQLAAITTLLRGMGRREFDPRSESAVDVSARVDAAPAVSQATLDAMTPEEVAALRTAARTAAEQRAAAEAAVAAATARSQREQTEAAPAPVMDADETAPA